MIGGVTTGSSFKGLMDYLFKKGKGKTISCKGLPGKSSTNQIAKSNSEVLIDNPKSNSEVSIDNSPKDITKPITPIVPDPKLKELVKQFLDIKYNKIDKTKLFFKGETEFNKNIYVIKATKEYFADPKVELNLEISKKSNEEDELESLLTSFASFTDSGQDINTVSILSSEEIEFLKSIMVELQDENSLVITRIKEKINEKEDSKEVNFEM